MSFSLFLFSLSLGLDVFSEGATILESILHIKIYMMYWLQILGGVRKLKVYMLDDSNGYFYYLYLQNPPKTYVLNILISVIEERFHKLCNKTRKLVNNLMFHVILYSLLCLKQC